MTRNNDEIYISVDVETSGPIPGEYSLLSIGACVIGNSDKTFYKKLKPTTTNYIPEALEVTGFSLEELEKIGEEPQQVMQDFTKWIRTVAGSRIPVFVGFNAPFDWSFINYYFHYFLNENPFGFTALDIKALYMGMARSSWRDTRSSKISAALKFSRSGDHNALNDAKVQAELFEEIWKHIQS